MGNANDAATEYTEKEITSNGLMRKRKYEDDISSRKENNKDIEIIKKE